MTMTTEELLRQLKTKQIVIFGAGFVAEMFYRALELHGAEGSLCFCAVTRAGSGQRFHGRPVLSLSEADIREDMLVCLAVHESAEDSLRDTLRPYEAQTVRVYPHLFELLYGAPVRYEAALPLAALLARQDREEYWLVVRYAAVRDYLAGGRDYPRSRELYLRSLELHCGEKTALRRVSQMEALASSVAEEGFRSDRPVRIDEAGRVIDGLHRIACAACLRIETIPALVYPVSPVFDRIFEEKNRLPQRTLRAAGFGEEDMRFLRACAEELFSPTSGGPSPERSRQK